MLISNEINPGSFEVQNYEVTSVVPEQICMS